MVSVPIHFQVLESSLQKGNIKVFTQSHCTFCNVLKNLDFLHSITHIHFPKVAQKWTGEGERASLDLTVPEVHVVVCMLAISDSARAEGPSERVNKKPPSPITTLLFKVTGDILSVR